MGKRASCTCPFSTLLVSSFSLPLQSVRGEGLASPLGKLSAQLTEGVTAHSSLLFPCKSKYARPLAHGPLSALRATPGDATGIPRFAPPCTGTALLRRPWTSSTASRSPFSGDATGIPRFAPMLGEGCALKNERQQFVLLSCFLIYFSVVVLAVACSRFNCCASCRMLLMFTRYSCSAWRMVS